MSKWFINAGWVGKGCWKQSMQSKNRTKNSLKLHPPMKPFLSHHSQSPSRLLLNHLRIFTVCIIVVVVDVAMSLFVCLLWYFTGNGSRSDECLITPAFFPCTNLDGHSCLNQNRNLFQLYHVHGGLIGGVNCANSQLPPSQFWYSRNGTMGNKKRTKM